MIRNNLPHTRETTVRPRIANHAGGKGRAMVFWSCSCLHPKHLISTTLGSHEGARARVCISDMENINACLALWGTASVTLFALGAIGFGNRRQEWIQPLLLTSLSLSTCKWESNRFPQLVGAAGKTRTMERVEWLQGRGYWFSHSFSWTLAEPPARQWLRKHQQSQW